MRTEIKELHQRLGTTTIYVTHDQVEAMTMADKIVVMRAGTVEQVGAPLELYDNPANLFVAGFIGSPAMNFLQGRITDEAAPAFMMADGIRLALPAAPKTARDRDIVYGIRPEQFAIDAANGVPAEIVVVEPTGSETQVIARLGRQSITTVFHGRVSAKPGETIPLAPLAASAHLFDAGNGTRISYA